MKLLKLLLPSFFAAYEQGQTQAFFERAYQVWFLRFPDPEHQITVEESYGEDPEYTEFIRKQREKVCINYCSQLDAPLTYQLFSG